MLRFAHTTELTCPSTIYNQVVFEDAVQPGLATNTLLLRQSA
jgi:hypothetical protein